MTPLEQSLKREVTALKREIASMRKQLALVNPFVGKSVEAYIAKLVGGQLTKGLACYDVTGADGTKFEVKFSALNVPHTRALSHRWSWGRPLGNGGAKLFDRLILVGQADPQYRLGYLEPRSPYVIFDVPFRGVQRLMRTLPLIQITTNPLSMSSEAGRELFDKFAVTRKQLQDRYHA